MAEGVAQAFWLRIERERIKAGWTKDRLSTETAGHTGDGRPIPRSTIDNLRTSTRAPQPRIVHALADAVKLDRGEAEELAGLIPPTVRPGQMSVRQAIEASPLFSDAQKRALLETVDAMEAANRVARPAESMGRTVEQRRAV